MHLYLTYPFVLSWSLLEAMSAGCLVIGSHTPTLTEVIRHGRNGLLVDFFDQADLIERIDEVLDHPDRMRKLRDEARRTMIRRFDLKTVAPAPLSGAAPGPDRGQESAPGVARMT